MKGIAIFGPNECLKRRLLSHLLEGSVERILISYIDLEPPEIGGDWELEFIEEVYEDKKAEINPRKCDICGDCIRACPTGAIREMNGKMVVKHYLCNGCSSCFYTCKALAIKLKITKTGDVQVWRRGENRLLTTKIETGSYTYDTMLKYIMRLSEKLSIDYGLKVIYIIGSFPANLMFRFLVHIDNIILSSHCYDEVDIDEILYYKRRTGSKLRVMCSEKEDEIIERIKRMDVEIVPYSSLLNILK